MHKRTLAVAAAALLATMGLATEASAAAAWEFTSASNSYTDGTWDFATAFSVNSNVEASGLGYYADPITGNVDGNQVALYQCADSACDSTGTLIANATVTNTYAIQGHFRYVTIAPVELIAGQSYEVAGVSNADDYTWNDTGFTTDPAISILTTGGEPDRWEMIGTPDFLGPVGEDSLSDGYWGPNVYLGSSSGFTSAAPEPSTWLLMLAGIGGIGLAFRRPSAIMASGSRTPSRPNDLIPLV